MSLVGTRPILPDELEQYELHHRARIAIKPGMLDELYSNAYIYTLPSDLEGMPLSLLEAMSYGNCCLVSDIPECVEVVEDKAIGDAVYSSE